MVSVNFNSRRSEVFATGGMVASSQPLATAAGLKILEKGGNAADAAVATAAALNVTEPTSTGIGGDAFALFFDNNKKKVEGINGSGRSPKALSLEKLHEMGITKLNPFSVHTITVPGAAACWVDTIERWGTMEMKEILEPAIQLAENGFPVAPLTARAWARGANNQLTGPNAEELLLNGRAPKAGEIMKNPNLANTFRELAENGKDGFYKGRIAEAIVERIQQEGGLMELEDLESHRSTFDNPISVNYRGVDVYEIPPNGQGITALIGLNILENIEISQFEHNSTKHLHVLIEAMRLAFADTRWYVADPEVVEVPIKELISKEYAKQRAGLIDMEKAQASIEKGTPVTSSDTVYFSVVDKDGNACSFINSNYMGFGTGKVPKGTGFTLQNRGHNFSLNPNHPNALAPNKRPYHTIIPGMALKDGELYASFGVMGGFMQPQGHVQVISNMVDFGMGAQEALDAPRFCIMDGTANGVIALEQGIDLETMANLASMGHPIRPMVGFSRAIFGRGQIIRRNPETGVLEGGSDPRADGLAMGLI